MEEGRLDQAPIWSDLSTFDPEPWRGVVDCITGGIPCQPFSVAGKQRAHEDERHLWPYVEKLVVALEPRLVCIENVSGHLARGTPDVVRDLRRLGYETAATLWRAEEVGAPHRRERVFIVGARVDDPEKRGDI
jgi:DNA (cytosine-5)-methyltransferase 1